MYQEFISKWASGLFNEFMLITQDRQLAKDCAFVAINYVLRRYDWGINKDGATEELEPLLGDVKQEILKI